jgi:anti-sigma factor RsiW
MSFERNDMNTIHLGNYEEFFILYMDNELSDDQVKMVDAFLLEHPDLRSEFEMLVSTKLPMEEFNFDKNDLLADNMKLSSIDEELLLYIDNELPADKKKRVELELSANKHYQLEHQLLMKTRLDASEAIAYPNKNELYRRTERVISMKVWMRVAAAVVIVAVGGIVYFTNPPSITPTPGAEAAPATGTGVQNMAKENTPVTSPITAPLENATNGEIAIGNEVNKKETDQIRPQTKERKAETPVENVTAYTTEPRKEDVIISNPAKPLLVEDKTEKVIAFNAPKEILNSGAVTSVNPNRTTIEGTPDEAGEPENRKGSLKGFLRKATRMIEKKTGIDPTNGNGDLLIGAVSINLK